MYTKPIEKDGKVLKTKDKKPLVDNRLEAGDEFIPCYNSIIRKEREALVKGKITTLTDYKLKCKVRSGGKILKVNDEEEIYVTLTPTQANKVQKYIDEDMEINQKLFVAYAYESKQHGEQVGVTLKKKFTPPKSFEDFEEENTE